MGVYDENIGAFRKRGKFAINGVSDIICTFNYNGINIVIFFEVKGHNGKQSPKQKAFEVAIKRHGGFYYVVRSVEETIERINEVKEEIKRRTLCTK